MPIQVGERKLISFDHYTGGHTMAMCYGAKSWDKADGLPVSEYVYYVEGVPQSERGEETDESGWWCEECCRKRGWLW